MNDNISERDVILGILHNEEFLSAAAESSLTEKDFDKKLFGWVYQSSVDFWRNQDYGNKKPTYNNLVQLARNDIRLDKETADKYIRIIKILCNKKPDNPNFSLQQIEKFSKTKKFIDGLEKAAEIIDNKKDINEAINMMNDYLIHINNSDNKDIEISDWLSSFEERQEIRKLRMIEQKSKNKNKKYKTLHFGIKKLDEAIPQGIKCGEFGAIGAKTGKGKSIFCVNLGLQALLQNLNVVHIITENMLEQIEGRYDSRLTNVEYNIIQTYDYKNRKYLLREQEKIFEFLRNSIKSKLKVVKCVPNETNIATIMKVVSDLERKEHIKYDVILIDSPELMRSLSKFNEYRLQKAAVYWEIKSYLMKESRIGFGSCQLVKAADDDVPTPEDMSEAYDKARILDYFLILIRTIKQMLLNEAAIAIAKTRDSAETGMLVPLRTDLKRMWIDTI